MKYGEVVKIRVNPTDCLSCVDVVQQVGLMMPGMSFSQVVRLALTVLLETARRVQHIPTRDGYEFSEVMSQFQSSRVRKLDITEVFDSLGSGLVVPALPGHKAEPESNTGQVKRLETRQAELLFKRKADLDNWSPEEQAELDRVTSQLVEAYKGV